MTENKNPFLKPYNTPHDTAPFHLIKIEHYEPALLEGMKEQNEEIDAIVNNPEAPTFQNTIVALENSGALLDRVTTVFGNLMSAETSDEMQELAEKMMPLLSEHSNNISLNEKLFARIKAVYEQKNQLQLKGEDAQLLQKTYDSFVRSGANLTGEAKEKFRQLNTELSILTLRFSQNLLKETNNYELALTKKQLEGLPESSLESYAQTAKDKGKEGSIITLDAPSFVPFMKYCDDRSLRREVYMAYNTQCTHNNDYNNVDIIKQLVNIRMELAHLLGFSTFAEYKLKKRMAKTSDAVYKLLNQLLEAYTPAALKEVAEVEALAREMEGNDFQLMPWDWAYYSQKIKFGMILAFQAMCRNEVTIHLIEGKTHSALQMAAFKFAYFVGRPFSYEKKYNWYNKFCQNCLCGNRKYIHRSNDQLRGMKMLVPAECMNEYIDIYYEGKQLMITKDYDKVLTISYGANYMTPIHDEANDDLHVHFREAFLKHLKLI